MPIIKTFWYVYKTNPVVGSMLAGVISLIGLTAWTISLWSVMTTNYQPVVSADNWLIGCQHCEVCYITFVALGILLI